MNNQTWDEAAAPVADNGEEDLRKLLVPNVSDLPPFPPSAVHSSFVAYYAPDFMKPAHDQFIYRHPNGYFFFFFLVHFVGRRYGCSVRAAVQVVRGRVGAGTRGA